TRDRHLSGLVVAFRQVGSKAKRCWRVFLGVDGVVRRRRNRSLLPAVSKGWTAVRRADGAGWRRGPDGNSWHLIFQGTSFMASFARHRAVDSWFVPSPLFASQMRLSPKSVR